ncbi:hypothetical protein RvY_02765 [Ramazzottius varieornatus]|uniref:Uncharacterized protein n=1 Tax=Ramazzottius varieornatus TaxID=947166 RepID=A0A1D1UKU4_RAMVA|nr:hypothetical protein RvY_02765 [Ramazzottius varieornatus]
MSAYSGQGVGSGYATDYSRDPVESVVRFMHSTQIVRSAVLLGGFIFAVMNRKLWFGVDLIATSLFAAAWFLFPQMLLDFQVSRTTLDGVDLQMARMYGAVLLGNAVLQFILTKFTKDPETVHPCLLFHRVITNVVLLIAMIDVQLFSKAWSHEHVTFGMLGAFLWALGSLVHLVRGGYPGGHLQRTGRPINKFLLFDFVLATAIGFTLYGFPRWFLRNFTLIRTLDGVHEHLTRAVGASLFGTGIFAFQAVGFQDDRDKEAHFIQRMVINGALFVSLLYSQFFYYKEWHMVNTWGVQFALILWFIHSYLGYTAEGYQLRYVPRTATGSSRITTSTRETIKDRSLYNRSPGGSILRDREYAGDYDHRDE